MILMLKMSLATLGPCTKFAPSRHDRGGYGMLKSGLALLALAGALALPLASAAATLTVYDISIVGTNAGVTGTITLDGLAPEPGPGKRPVLQTCTISSACIADYDLRITVDGQSFDLLGPGSGDNSEFFLLPSTNIANSGLRYSTAGLFFHFTPSFGNSEALFESPGIGLGQDLLCLTAGDACFYDHPDGSGVVLAVGGQPAFIAFTGDVQIGALAVPEPATWAMLLLGFAGAGAGLRASRRRGLSRRRRLSAS